jgi:hypothetical protein
VNTETLWVSEAYNPRLKKKCEFTSPKCKLPAKYLVGQCEYGDMGQYVHHPGLYEVCSEHLAASVLNAIKLGEL